MRRPRPPSGRRQGAQAVKPPFLPASAPTARDECENRHETPSFEVTNIESMLFLLRNLSAQGSVGQHYGRLGTS